MPTGYTDNLDKNGFDTKKWVAESLARAFGVCVVLRDEGDMSEEAIIERLRENAESSYYDKALKEANTKIEKLSSMTIVKKILSTRIQKRYGRPNQRCMQKCDWLIV